VDATELAAGLCLLCDGNKSVKLAYAFHRLLDDDGDGCLTRRGLWRLLRAFLTVLLVLSHAASALTADELTCAADDGAVWVSAAVFAGTPTAKPNKIRWAAELGRGLKAASRGRNLHRGTQNIQRSFRVFLLARRLQRHHWKGLYLDYLVLDCALARLCLF
ncbi:unnamed protein product, partial [Phaeothamnion confervicola]